MHSALDTPEILEMVLAQLDMRTLLTSAQRVCHSWASLAAQSPVLQRALFFTPIKDANEWGMNEKMLNPLLTEAFPSIFPDPPKDEDDKEKRFNFRFSDLPIATLEGEARARFIRPDASWRRMLVSQPPMQDISLMHLRHGMGGDSAECWRVPADTTHAGLRMERLFEVLLFHNPIRDRVSTKSRVYWVTGDGGERAVAFDEGHRQRNIKERFYALLRQSGVVVYTRETVQCCEEGESD
ncbi:uncharacterized protein DSM5745_10149 [Aspergillus mulundensis]|uniref:F-box domain-containing protein n=1 Tax=Aspergillus mulundensis TaxID=1810919 RepID=A0A3D8QMW3_9EURO|nr:hypothetical protein DSM5745_10149 [Aspergillus mulundensis]RDW63038.1 hypothetical protein DSM5745_10149 [Aspergillus mulundensis]